MALSPRPTAPDGITASRFSSNTPQPSRHDASDRTADVVAFHYGVSAEVMLELGRVEGLSVDIVAKALEWIEEAAGRAEKAQMLAVAARLYTQALRLVPESEPAKKVTYLLGRAASETDQRLLEPATTDIAHALKLATEIDDPALIARAVLALGESQQKGGDLEAALDKVRPDLQNRRGRLVQRKPL